MGNHKQFEVICDGMEIKPKDKGWTSTSSHTAWILLACSLFIATFGVTGAVNSIIYAILFTFGLCIVVGYHSVGVSRDVLSASDVTIPSHGKACIGLEKILDSIKDSPSSFKFDKRLTGSSNIDEALQEVLENFFRDYISYWYTKVSEHEQFPYDLRQSLQSAIITLANRFKDVEWVPFFTTKLVDDFATHLKIFRVFRERLTRRYDDMGSGCKVYPDLAHEIDEEEVFFQVEREIEKGISREAICRDDEKEILYLQTVAETLLYLLLPSEDFRNITTKYFLREIIACSVLLPTFNMICDPDYVNQTVSWLCTKEETYTIETFLTAIKITDDTDDLEETIRKLDSEITKLRALDSESALSTESENMMKKRLSSLLYVRKLCAAHCKRLKGGEIVDPMANPLEGGPEVELLNLLGQNAPKLPLKTILENNTALSYYIEFMAGHTAEHYVFFYLTVEGFRVTAEQQLSILAEQTLKAQDNGSPQPGEKDFEQLKQAAANIYEEYISPKASPRINLDDQVVRKIVRDIKSSEPSGSYFDTAQIQVLKVLESPKYYGAFLSSISYVKCLMDLDYLKEKSDDGTVDDDVVSTTSFDTSNSKEYKSETDLVETIWTLESDSRYSATIIKCGVCKEGGKAYGVYSIQVCRTTSEGSANWVVCRRYSDFHDLHVQLREKFNSLSWLSLPSKKTFGTLDKNFIEKRKVALEEYLQIILSTTIMSENPGMFELVAGFLEMGEYYKGKGMLSRTVHDLVQPLKSSVSTVSNALRSKTEPVSKNNIEPPDKKTKEVEQDLILSKLSENFDSDVDDNIPLRILLLLMDEIFDLKDRNQWLRRRIVVTLRQFIKATFGDRINRKIVDSVEWATSAQQLTEYVRNFRDSFWPGGVLAEAAPIRPDDVRRRMRMVTRAKMIGSIPDELKRFLGTEVTREGVIRMFDMLQHVNLNKRLLYVLLESFLETVFPGNKFRETFMKIHSKSKF